jgi:hypothetical protein
MFSSRLTGDPVNRRLWLGSFCSALLAASVGVSAQPRGRTHRIGILGVRPPDPSDPETVRLDEVFVQVLRDRGYVEGDNLIIERRYWGGVVDRLPKLAAELASLKLDVIAVSSPSSYWVRAVRRHHGTRATRTWPRQLRWIQSSWGS